MTLLTCLATVVFAGGGASIVTGGPPSVAILVEAMSASAEAGGLACSGAAGAASLAGAETSSGADAGVDVAIFVSSAAAGATACAGAASCWAGLSAAGISGLAVSGGDEFSGCSAAVLSGSAGTVVTSGSAGVAVASGSAGFAVTSGSAGTALVAGCSAGVVAVGPGPALSPPRPVARRAASPERVLSNGSLSSGLEKQVLGFRSAAQKPVRGSHATTACWQIPRERRAATPRRRVRTPVSTSTTRSRRTENESRGAWTPVPPSRDRLRRPLSQRERGDDRIAAFPTRRAPPARSESG